MEMKVKSAGEMDVILMDESVSKSFEFYLFSDACLSEVCF